MRLAPLVVLACLVPLAYGWGWEGHQIVGRIAEGLVNEKAAAQIKSILENDSCGPEAPCKYGATLSGCASWADDVKKSHEWQWTAPVHYIDSPDSKDLSTCGYRYNRDCYDHNYGMGAGYCVTGGINNYTAQLKAGINMLNESDSACALKFLTHYVGDVHQPLHVGFTSDRGGNLETVWWYGNETAKGYDYVLHALWDYDIIEKYLDDTYPGKGFTAWEDYAADLLKNITPADQQAWSCQGSVDPTCVDTWAVESITDACKYAYRDGDGNDIAFTNGTHLAGKYYSRNIPVVDLRLRQGGARLAEILNSIWS